MKNLRIHIDAVRIRDKNNEKRTITAVKIIESNEQFSNVQEQTKNSNEAKYSALIKALEILREKAKKTNIESATIYSDCWMVVDQQNEKIEVKEDKILALKEKADSLVEDIKAKISVEYIPRIENKARELVDSYLK